MLKRSCLKAKIIQTYNVSMQARPKGHITIKMAEAHPTTKRQKKIVLPNAALYNNRSYNRKGLTFHVFPKDPCRRLVSPQSTIQRTFISYNCFRNIFWA